jgi:hypothetical protein|tara:strand:- start:423 stop:1310 length:888 start_codon:yes stop_codon:yes gene_type:complete
MSEQRQGYPIQTEAQLAAHVSRPFDDIAKARLRTQLQPDDIIISTFPKCGTTWSAQIAHGLRSNGDMSFESLGQVFPWFETGHFFGQDLESTRAFTPALFKSHMALSELPRGGKVINIIRDPGDTLMSYYNFWADVLFDPNIISLEMMARQLFLLDRSEHPRNMFRLNYYQHLVDFHTGDYDGPVLFIAYEDMKINLPAAVRRISRFIGFNISKILERKITQQSTFEFMSRHSEKFTEQVPNGLMEMVVTGRVGDAKQGLDENLKRQLEDAWQDYVTPQLGYRSYAELREAISLK